MSKVKPEDNEENQTKLRGNGRLPPIAPIVKINSLSAFQLGARRDFHDDGEVQFTVIFYLLMIDIIPIIGCLSNYLHKKNLSVVFIDIQ